MIDVPSTDLIEALYEAAVLPSSNNDDNDDDKHTTSHQSVLDQQGHGLLSLEEVWIPAVARTELDALKCIQARAQRDQPSLVPIVQDCRRLVLSLAASAVHGAREGRQEREGKEQERLANDKAVYLEKRAELKQKKEEARRKRVEEMARQQAAAVAKTKREMQKKDPRNVELWREVAQLMTERARLEKEAKLWKDADTVLALREADLQEREQSASASAAEDAAKNAEEEEQKLNDTEDVKQHEMSMASIQDALESIELSSQRIQRAVGVVQETMQQSDEIRKELYGKYSKDHFFRGYAGIKNPKGLISILSQED